MYRPAACNFIKKETLAQLFYEHLFLQAPPEDCFCIKRVKLKTFPLKIEQAVAVDI